MQKTISEVPSHQAQSHPSPKSARNIQQSTSGFDNSQTVHSSPTSPQKGNQATASPSRTAQKRPGVWSLDWSAGETTKKKAKTVDTVDDSPPLKTTSPSRLPKNAIRHKKEEVQPAGPSNEKRSSRKNDKSPLVNQSILQSAKTFQNTKNVPVLPPRFLHSARTHSKASTQRAIKQASLPPYRFRLQSKRTTFPAIPASPTGKQEKRLIAGRSLSRGARDLSPSTSSTSKTGQQLKTRRISEFAHYNAQIKVIADSGEEEDGHIAAEAITPTVETVDGTSSRTLRAFRRARSPDTSPEIKKELIEIALHDFGKKLKEEKETQNNQKDEREEHMAVECHETSSSCLGMACPDSQIKGSSVIDGGMNPTFESPDPAEKDQLVEQDDNAAIHLPEIEDLTIGSAEEPNTIGSSAPVLQEQALSIGETSDCVSPTTLLDDGPQGVSQEPGHASHSRACSLEPVVNEFPSPAPDAGVACPLTPRQESTSRKDKHTKVSSSEPCVYNALLASSLLGIKAVSLLHPATDQEQLQKVEMKMDYSECKETEAEDKEESPYSDTSKNHVRNSSTSTIPISVLEDEDDMDTQEEDDDYHSVQEVQESFSDASVNVPTLLIDSLHGDYLANDVADGNHEKIGNALLKAQPEALNPCELAFLHPLSFPKMEFDEYDDLAESLYKINMPSPRTIYTGLPGNTPPNNLNSVKKSTQNSNGFERSESVQSVLWSRSTGLQGESAILKFKGKECCLIPEPEAEDLVHGSSCYNLNINHHAASSKRSDNTFDAHPATPQKWKEHEKTLTLDDYENYDLPLLQRMTLPGVIADYGNKDAEPILSAYQEGGFPFL